MTQDDVRLKVGAAVWIVQHAWVSETKIVEQVVLPAFDGLPESFIGYKVRGALDKLDPVFVSKSDVFARPVDRQRLIERLQDDADCLARQINELVAEADDDLRTLAADARVTEGQP